MKLCTFWIPIIYQQCVRELWQQLVLWDTIAGSNGLLKFVSAAKDKFISAVAKVLTNLVDCFVHGWSNKTVLI